MEELNFSQSLDRFKESFLWAAAQGGNTEDCESLLGIGADINWKHQDGDTALLAACRRGHTHTVESLVAHGADINLTGADSLSPLHICCLRGDFPTLNILLNANPNLSLKTKDGKTAMQLAEAKGHENICSRLNSLISSHSSGGNSSSRSSSSRSTRHNEAESLERFPSRQNRPLPSISSSLETLSLSALDTTPPPTTTPTAAMQRQSSSSSRNSQRGSSASSSTPLPHTAPPVPLRTSSSLSSSSSSSCQSQQLQHLPSTTSYQLMGQHILPNHDEGSIALRKLLEVEIKEKKTLDAKVKRLEEEIIDLGTLNATLADQLNEMQSENEDLTEQLAQFSSAAIDRLVTLKECEALESKLKSILHNIEHRKNEIRSKELESKNGEQRLCVICQEKEKSVVLFPCRHMCLCDECSTHEDLDTCPLCRRTIIQRISVFS